MNNSIVINPISYVYGNVYLPGSKSISNRAILLSAQTEDQTQLINLPNNDDITVMLQALNCCKVKYKYHCNNQTCNIQGNKNALKSFAEIIFLKNSGTAMRLLTAAFSIRKNNVVLMGSDRMHQRPIGPLVDALRQGGAKINYLNKKNFPPLKIFGGYRGGHITINCNISSQFLTALLIMAPLAPKDTVIYIKKKITSLSYIKMTMSIMKIFNIFVQHNNYKIFYLKGKCFYKSPKKYVIEGDASSASYFLAAGAIKGKNVQVFGINKDSIQGEIKFAHILKNIGANIHYGKNYILCSRNHLNRINVNVFEMPDSGMTAAIVALFCKKYSILKNVQNWKLKECNRIEAILNGLKKIGVYYFYKNNNLIIHPPKKFIHATIETYEDHRIAMCFSLLALSEVSIRIIDPSCVKKSFPKFFETLNNISYSI
ncbi:3-phosphoshikimate 1-carboxyvinyltransferase [Wigglesworthia glossinidia endosymbiont of Glossina morsitans morsitans (Yale colony)]|uniref:3-phosphoshikimate 1-carboxyvinyltransferase n=1 Tax=Wigglesworthia glossinidia endosymbiont of Glossina morsitans morsitans (Yale colony) TaxID=1142511 RepID=H6Q4Q2_WIGGL|nr:3-phosphoshikimate 1-carboxyvinyltransferase [Wigglesworthia glossinidia]AFA41112.1 3-phosphoshikimate 1-carboxyvinyltransferase [Wigglesworthia glossinidia endosymbiont of Glossina morsitans morsitans (Yale colony)]